MKISVLTATYNRAGLLRQLYTSLLVNSKFDAEIEWLIMDDGSTDNTQRIVEDFQKDKIIEIKYAKQKNKGKMVAINELVRKVTGDLVIECDSDDYFTEDAFNIMKDTFQKYETEENLYAFCFEKIDKSGNKMADITKEGRTTLFDLYFKEGESGEKALVFFSEVRKQFSHCLEKEERFVTEARMYHQMDRYYQILCVPKPIMICDYQEGGYTKNIRKVFAENPFGYYEYFREIFEQDTRKMTFSKWLYAIKHYILFAILTKEKHPIQKIGGYKNKVMVGILYFPGWVKSKLEKW